MSRYDRRDELISVFDEAWKAVAAEDAEAMRLETAQRSGLEEHRAVTLKVNRLCTVDSCTSMTTLSVTPMQIDRWYRSSRHNAQGDGTTVYLQTRTKFVICCF